MNKKQKTKILERTKEIFEQMLFFLPYDVIYSFHTTKNKENGSGGFFAIYFEPTTKKIDFYIYDSLYNEVDTLNKRQILWLKFTIAHEIGHIFIWELSDMTHKKFNHDITEKTASDIAFLLIDLYNKKYEK